MATPGVRGRLIVFEGIDGAGKTTQIQRLKATLEAQGRRIFCTAEPTDGVSGKMLREALGGKIEKSVCEMAALFTLDRIYHNVDPEQGIRRMLEEGVDVICDRYYYSSLAYQGSQTDPAWVRAMNLDCPEITRPDLCVFLDLTPEESLARIQRGRETQEIYENYETLKKVRDRFFEVFEELKETDRIVVVNAARPIEVIADEIARIVADA